ncbi:DUF4179 domain-containing protein [Paenibacillus sedimenti]|uniref:DUF4179 domain-containing protein n=1 Tax=Paenibacillus sedimenti TaxID=2770274 RepID=A0A926QKV7_9BACL|nr:DUF4179 domain-containing protein [Paenibacillus sedimenti]MBD0381912.1 DUF4179 domain-containing protein [Paenibacillus sedimenti]
MENFNIEKELKKLESMNTEMSPLVRSRLDETYRILSRQTPHIGRKKSSLLRQLTLSTAAAGVLGIGMFASAFLSPVMAETLKQVPGIGSIFSTIQRDIGLRTAGDFGLTSNVNRTVSYKDVKLEVTETLYDGNRAAFVLNVTAPNLDNGTYNNGKKNMKLSDAIENVFFTVDGKRLNEGGFYGSAGEAHPNTLVFEHVVDPKTTPDSFNSTVMIKLDGIDHEFAVDIPFLKTTKKGIEISPNIVTAGGDLSFSLSQVWVTPITTRLTTTTSLTGAETLTHKEENRLIKIGIAVFDDQGRRLPALNGDGIIEGNRLIFDRRYASTPGTSKYLTVKPFVIKDDFTEDVQEDQYLKALEMKIDLPSAN